MKRSLILLTAMAFFGCGAILAQESTQTIKGVVIDPNGNPVPGAEIRATRGVEVTNADADGTYEMVVPSNLKSVTISYPGYKTRKIRLDGTPYYVTEFKLARKKNRSGFFDIVGGPTIVSGSTGFKSSDVQGHLGLMMGGTINKWGWYYKVMLRVGGKVDFTNWDPEDSLERSLYLMPMLTVGVVHKFSTFAAIFGGVGLGTNALANYETVHGYMSNNSYNVDIKIKPAIEIGGIINFTKNFNCIFGLTYTLPARNSEEISSTMYYDYFPGKNSGWYTPFIGIGYNMYPKK